MSETAQISFNNISQARYAQILSQVGQKTGVAGLDPSKPTGEASGKGVTIGWSLSADGTLAVTIKRSWFDPSMQEIERDIQQIVGETND